MTTSDDPDESEKLETAAEDEKAETAVTTKRPTKCCPDPIEGPLVRSSRVLRKFCTPQQWKDWCVHGWLICYGHLSGHAYRLVHRHHPAAKVQGKICYDLDDRQTLHAYDWSTPPAEEVLAFKLILENIEPWLRCEATGFGPMRGHFGRSIGFTDPTDNGYAEPYKHSCPESCQPFYRGHFFRACADCRRPVIRSIIAPAFSERKLIRRRLAATGTLRTVPRPKARRSSPKCYRPKIS